ncbi:hypothetical protein H5410_026197 [Solanum commersonii]|uniref:Uncharacterized protein n=1 Tax=Solanum commersonii TaxID=4109 RepID=A0A9J5YVV8_SOLCO|nr:hypothetical protein H5410_026197 [Solanum commersonii]
MDVQYDLINDVNWSRGPNERIFRFKRTQSRKTQILPIFMSYSPWIFCDRISKFFLIPDIFCQNFSWMCNTTLLMTLIGLKGQTNAFKVQAIPKAGKPKFYQFLCALVHEFFVILVPREKLEHFQVQTSSKKNKAHILPIFVRYSPLIFGDTGFWNLFYQNFSWTSLRPY